MHCPYCRDTDTRVIDSRVAEDGASIRRRRSCSACNKRFTTVEMAQLTVRQAVGRQRAVRPRQGRRRRPQGLQGPAGHRGRPGLPRPAGRGRAAPVRRCRGAGQRDRPGHLGPAARPRRRRLPALLVGLQAVRLRRRLRGRDRQPARPPRRAARTAARGPRLSPERLTTDHPVRRGEAAYRVHHLGAPWQPCGYVGAISNTVEQGPTRVGTEEHRHMTETVSGAAKRTKAAAV